MCFNNKTNIYIYATLVRDKNNDDLQYAAILVVSVYLSVGVTFYSFRINI